MRGHIPTDIPFLRSQPSRLPWWWIIFLGVIIGSAIGAIIVL